MTPGKDRGNWPPTPQGFGEPLDGTKECISKSRTEKVRLLCWLCKQIRMCAGAVHNDLVIGYVVYKQPVVFYVTLP
jgi:hypothetical protein